MRKITLLIVFFVCIGASVNAQTFKFGHINTQELVSLMSEMDSATVKMEAYRADLVETMEGMQNEYTTKYNDYQRKQATWTPAVKQAKEGEIQEMIQRIQQFEQSAQQEMQQMNQILMAPVYQKAQEAINKVAKENGMTYIFDISAGSIIYMDETVSVNILPLAKKELGIPAEKVAPTQRPQAEATK
ncbi:MAG: OmpH family outer membrane protein [Bacteroidales bacterium]|nr:OmpH family outer membrane protein [Bacteroidales bacterium]MDD4669711.1 OmpH family outer membrane protein [Bacteroidales bacterium]